MAFVSKAARNWARVAVVKGAMAALLTRMSRRPWVEVRCEAALVMSVSEVRSRGRKEMLPGRERDWRVCRAVVPRVGERAVRTTW